MNIANAGIDAPIRTLLKCFEQHRRFLITSHARPDGDAVGSVLAMAELLELMGCEAKVVMADEAPAVYQTLPGLERIVQVSDAGKVEPDPTVPVILLECDGIPRTGLSGLEGRMLINIDHHASGRRFADVNWIDEDACAVAEMIYRITLAAGVKVTSSMATCLYTAVLSDTGSFNYSTSASTFQMVQDLAEHGANPCQIARDLYFSNPESKIRLLGTALSNLKTDGPLAWSWVTTDDMDRAGAGAEDCEGVVNYLISIAGVESAVFLRELPSAEYRLSIRSKGKIDVAQVAEAFGGGGHRSASGCTLEGPLAAATERILNQLRMSQSQLRMGLVSAV